MSKFIKEVQEERSSYGIQSRGGQMGGGNQNESQVLNSANNKAQFEQTGGMTNNSGGNAMNAPLGTNINLMAAAGGQGGKMDMRALKVIQDMLAEHENLLTQHQQMIEEKVDNKTMESLLASKIGNNEITDLLPDMDMYEKKFASQLEEGLETLSEKLEEKFIIQDARMNKIRNEFDMTTLNSFISTKAD